MCSLHDCCRGDCVEGNLSAALIRGDRLVHAIYLSGGHPHFPIAILSSSRLPSVLSLAHVLVWHHHAGGPYVLYSTVIFMLVCLSIDSRIKLSAFFMCRTFLSSLLFIFFILYHVAWSLYKSILLILSQLQPSNLVCDSCWSELW